MTNEETIKYLEELAGCCNYEVDINSKDVEVLHKAIGCIRKVNEVEHWLDPDIDSEKALEKIREIIYG